MVAFAIGSVAVLVWLVGIFLASLFGGESSQSSARQRAVARQNADTLARAVRVKEALDAEAFRAHRQMVDHATATQRARQSGH